MHIIHRTNFLSSNLSLKKKAINSPNNPSYLKKSKLRRTLQKYVLTHLYSANLSSS